MYFSTYFSLIILEDPLCGVLDLLARIVYLCCASTLSSNPQSISLSARAEEPQGFGGAGNIYLPVMTNNEAMTNGHAPEDQSQKEHTSFAVKTGLAKMLKGGVIMDVVNAEQVWISSPLHVSQIPDSQQLGKNSGRSRRMCSHGARESPGRYPSPRWCGTHVRP